MRVLCSDIGDADFFSGPPPSGHPCSVSVEKVGGLFGPRKSWAFQGSLGCYPCCCSFQKKTVEMALPMPG